MSCKFSKEQIQNLEEIISHYDCERVKYKAKIILEYNSSTNKKHFCKEYNLCMRTIQRWIQGYNKKGAMGLVDKEFKKKSYINDSELNAVVNDLKINPIEYGLPYSIWDEFTVKQYLVNNLKNAVNSSPATIKKIIEKCKSLYGNSFFDYGDDIKFYENMIDKSIQQGHKCLCCAWYFLSYKEIKEDSQKASLVHLSSYNEYYYGFVVRILGWDDYIGIETSMSKKLSVDKIYKFFKDIIKEIVLPKEKYIIITDSSKPSRLAIQKLYIKQELLNNIQFLTISTKIRKELDGLKFIDNIKSKIILGHDCVSKRIDMRTFDEDSKICFNNRSIKTMETYLEFLLYYTKNATQ